MSIKSQIPNLITLLNLLSGCIAIVFVSQLQFEWAFFFVCLGIFLDFFDGFFARLFKVQSPLGLQLDSLADMVTSGVAPGYVMFQMILKAIGGNQELSLNTLEGSVMLLPFLGFIISLGACFRLANFNIDTRQTDSFIGVPTPANSLFIMSFPLVIKFTDISIIVDILHNPYILLLITALSAYVMNAEIPLFSLKIKQFTWSKNALQILFLTLSVVLLLVFKYLGIPLIIIAYILLSVINNLFLKKG
ncbi:CDP-alcohol phosphatidyltransferase family protein [Flavobacterium columnare]|uniref:CDP-alcohol phosphatidyltransferase n=1 Tax=Flavobacterium columnare (strain ATCC 49512 / CIP 103533 / TG 44/87) TaxID=1041826 RepID=G8XAN0_FLACA|nr:CDP-alcohol phosphatidyltransferase family protein [Flavobacterium columnare]AEW87336.1 CDP-alcohol phosphatidyltransferase [Flavobacterium columnare ATCC 49512]ANO48327.1 CDP-alcohol phosphatidyltransferase [Flavobacterium columnare]MBF6652551.1 phosphatidylserine synthase [Flavobacterium columnare]MBF6655564.1 phosphatidylserine synthase [Flavobacterium columnare]PTD14858.1 phosphatidylserine synthase [Flavobacterium columnare]